jgi:DNA-binding LytR/AlgR family response regulator
VSYTELTAQVLLINLLIGPVIWWVRRPSARTIDRAISRTAPSAPAEPDPLRSKLPFALRNAAILSLSAEDHYVRLRTDRGQALILMNLADAVASLGPEAGVRIHRSHWVARDVARGATRQAGRLVVRLDNDTVLPVSRAGQKLLRDCHAAGIGD